MEEVALDFRGIHISLTSHSVQKLADSFGSRRPDQDRVDRNSGSGGRLGDAARQPDLGGLGHAIVNHLDRKLHGRFARNEENSSPVRFQHAGQIMTGKPYAAHDVGLPDPLPMIVVDIHKGDRLEDPEIVYQDVGLWMFGDQFLRCVSYRQIAGKARQAATRRQLPDAVERLLDTFLAAAIHDDVRAFPGEFSSNSEPDARRRTGYNSALAL